MRLSCEMGNHSNNNSSNHEDGNKNLSKGSVGVGGATRSWGTTISGQSISTSGSVGSPSTRSEAAMATTVSDSALLRMNNLDIQGDDAGSQGAADMLMSSYSSGCKCGSACLDKPFHQRPAKKMKTVLMRRSNSTHRRVNSPRASEAPDEGEDHNLDVDHY